MENKLFEKLDGLRFKDTTLLLEKDINLSLDYLTRKRIERSIKKKMGYYDKSNILVKKINDILGGLFMKKRLALALIVGVILSSAEGGYAYAYVKTPVAYVSMDINPSVELGVNAFDKVISVEAYNEDGKKILEGTNLINYDIDNAVSTVISNAISEGYINKDGSSAIEITTSTNKENIANKLEKSLKDVTDETLNSNDIDANIQTENVALARRDEARKLGITPGKLNLIQKLQELDPTINIENYKDSSVKNIQEKTKELIRNSKNDEIIKAESTNADTSDDVITDENTYNNGDNKKEENSNSNSKKEGSNNSSNIEKDTTTISGEQNNSNNLNSQSNNNSNSQNNNGNKEKSNNK
ncbi:MAG TPA: hypothetical protein VF839_10020 [Clostridium sp.]